MYIYIYIYSRHRYRYRHKHRHALHDRCTHTVDTHSDNLYTDQCNLDVSHFLAVSLSPFTYFRPLLFLTRKNTRFLSLSLSLSLSHEPFESLQSWPDTKQDSTAALVPRICVCHTHTHVCVMCECVHSLSDNMCLCVRVYNIIKSFFHEF